MNAQDGVIFPLKQMIKIKCILLVRKATVKLNLKNVKDYYTPNAELDPLSLPFHQTIKIIENDQNTQYFSEQNGEFLEESGLHKTFSQLDPYIKPDFNIDSKYDLMTGSVNMSTPLRYHTNYRRFISVVSGKIHIKMAPWKNTKHLYPIRDFEFYEFYSPVHPHQPAIEHASDFEKINFLHFDVVKGQCLYIPPYWWYSVQYLEHNTFVSLVYYTTVMNLVANLPDLSRYYLQQQNITKTISKRPPSTTNLDVTELTAHTNAVEDEIDKSSEQQNISGIDKSSEQQNITIENQNTEKTSSDEQNTNSIEEFVQEIKIDTA
jgi:hypothetical protein